MPLPTPLAGKPPHVQERVIRSMPEATLRDWAAAFAAWAHRGQVAPEGDWRTWVIMGGRGFGKTRAGAEWVLEQVRGAGRGVASSPTGPHPSGAVRLPPSPGGRGLRVALVGATIDDARAVMVEGPSGLLALARDGEIGGWVPAKRRLEFSNGAVAELFSGRSPQGLRGPEHDLAWCDELGKWARAGEAWDMLQLGLRRGDNPRAVVTTTPSAEPALVRLLAAADTVRGGGGTHANPHLPRAFLDAIERAYAGTRLYGEEVAGVLNPDRQGSLWPGALLAASRGPRLAPEACRRVVIGVDPPASAAGTCGIVVAGLVGEGESERAWVLADASVEGASPEGWARAVVRAAAEWGADRVVAEVNQGGDMVASVLKVSGCATLPLRLVHAARGKAARAEPVAALFETGRAGLAGIFPALEGELAGFVAGGWRGEGSPDRADAMVWALWALCLEGRGEPAVRLTF